MSPRTTTDWDAKTYDRLASPQEEWARAVIEQRLPLAGDEILIDAGCGSGRVTRLLLERLPRGRVLGVDGSPSMIANAQEELGEYGDRLALLACDLLELEPALVEDSVGVASADAVFSNATFHWIADHERLFGRLFDVLRPGGRLVAQCGGTGNVPEWVRAVQSAAAREPFATHLEGFWPWSFYGPEQTETRLRAAGFEQVSCWLEDYDSRPEDPRNWVAVVGLAPHHERLPTELREPFTDEVLAELPDPLVHHYVRLNLDARRPTER